MTEYDIYTGEPIDGSWEAERRDLGIIDEEATA